MDDIVRQAIAKWPNVPDCYGWLALDARGNWYLRDVAAQAAGAFQSGLPGSRGELLEHERLLAFIGRNYACDARGCWFFQNGPQRVFVELEAAPWIWRLSGQRELTSQTGVTAVSQECLVDSAGWVFLHTDLGLGLVHSQDVALVAAALEEGVWQLADVDRSALPDRYGFVLSPEHEQGGARQGV